MEHVIFQPLVLDSVGTQGRLPGERGGEGQWKWGGEMMKGKGGEEERAVGRRESGRDHDGLVDIQSASPS